MKLLAIIISGLVINVSFAAMPPAAGAGAGQKSSQNSRAIHVAPPAGSVASIFDSKAAHEPEAPPAYSTPTSKATQGLEAPPPRTPLSVAIPQDPTIEIVVVSVPPTTAPLPTVPPTPNPDEALVDLRNGSTALAHVVAQAAAARDDFAADLGPVSTKWCLSHLTDQELERETSRAQASDRKWSQEYRDFEAKISAEQQKIANARSDQALAPAAINAVVTTATQEISKLNKLFIEHKKKPYPYFNTSLEHLEWAKKIREYNNSKAHLCCLDRWCESKPACCCGYCDCPRKEICKWSCLFLGGMAAVGALFTPLFLMAHEKQK